jgi:hypothetical protein
MHRRVARFCYSPTAITRGGAVLFFGGENEKELELEKAPAIVPQDYRPGPLTHREVCHVKV